jgi:hypothetical protein
MRIFPKALAGLVVLAACLSRPAHAVGQSARSAAAANGTDAAQDQPAPSYARADTLELGGFAHFMVAKDYSSLGLFPTIGWFPWDNIELSAIIGVTRVGQTIEDENDVRSDVSRTQLLILAEPSFHVPFSEVAYGFLGVGLGLAHEARTPGPGAGPGFAVAPRLGLNLVIARSGVLTPAVQASYQTTAGRALEPRISGWLHHLLVTARTFEGWDVMTMALAVRHVAWSTVGPCSPSSRQSSSACSTSGSSRRSLSRTSA